uniref:ORF43l n=1 Tax=Pinus koraiensis TaxID=88728 RepID=A4QMA1_PINKO|nr:ORF43l [Pinus koraiensis]ABP35438.1 ORF43l [Pinus koraiensis]
MRLILSRHPSTNTFVQENIFCVESLRFRIFCCTDLLGNKIIGT